MHCNNKRISGEQIAAVDKIQPAKSTSDFPSVFMAAQNIFKVVEGKIKVLVVVDSTDLSNRTSSSCYQAGKVF